MDLNPYEELGVDRGADETAIRKAYRKAVKQAHPDAGGTAEALLKVSTALAVLTDPKKRKTYDDTGRIEEDRPDNDRAAALQVIDMHVGQIVNDFIASGFAPEKDPRRMNAIDEIRKKIRAEIMQAQDGIKGGENVVEFMRDMMKRFSLANPGASPEDDPIGRGLDRQIRNAEQQLSDIKANIRQRRLALTIVDGYRYRFEPHDDNPMAQGFNIFTVAEELRRGQEREWRP